MYEKNTGCTVYLCDGDGSLIPNRILAQHQLGYPSVVPDLHSQRSSRGRSKVDVVEVQDQAVWRDSRLCINVSTYANTKEGLHKERVGVEEMGLEGSEV